MVIELNNNSNEENINNFFNTIKSKEAVLIFVKAEWCQPCVNMDKVFSEFTEKYKAFFEKYDIPIFKIDVETSALNQFLDELNILVIPYIALINKIDIAEDNFVKDFSIIWNDIREYVNEDEFKWVMSNNLKVFVDNKNNENKNQT